MPLGNIGLAFGNILGSGRGLLRGGGGAAAGPVPAPAGRAGDWLGPVRYDGVVRRSMENIYKVSIN